MYLIDVRVDRVFRKTDSRVQLALENKQLASRQCQVYTAWTWKHAGHRILKWCISNGIPTSLNL